MTTAYTSLLGLALPVTGELSGVWGDTVNNSITSLLDSAIAGTQTLTADTTLTTTTGAANQSRQAILLCSPASANITITAPAQSKIYTVINTSATYTVTIVGVGPTTGVTLGVSEKAVVAWNGSDFVRISNTGGAGVFTSITDSGNLTFTGTGNRITGDFSNATIASRVAFQTSTTNAATTLQVLPNGTSVQAAINLEGDPAATTGGVGQFTITSTDVRISSAIRGAGTYLPITFYNGGAERVRIDTSGNVGIGTSAPAEKLQINGGGLLIAGTATTNNYSGLVLDYNSGTGEARVSAGGVSGASSFLTFTTANGGVEAEKMRIDSSGNVGIGVTPSAWGSSYRAIQMLGGGVGIMSIANGGYYLTNAYFDGSSFRYVGTAGAMRYEMNSGNGHTWYTAPSGTAGNAITFTQAMTLNASGSLGIGTTSLTGITLAVGKTITGAITSYGVLNNGTIQSDVTNAAIGYQTSLSTQAAAFTLTNLTHFAASQATIGATSVVTSQYGFVANSNLTGATNNYGFYGNIASGTSRYNLYMNGTADNYLAGNVGIGKNTPTTKLEVAGAVANALIRINRTDNAAARGALQWTGNDDVVDWQIGTNMVASGGLEFSTAAASGLLMTLDTTGNLGIGTSSPSTYGAKLAVYSAASSVANIQITNPGVGTGTIGIEAASSNFKIYNSYASATLASGVGIDIDTAGNVGIGTTSPGSKLDVSSSGANLVSSRSTGSYSGFVRYVPTGQQAYDFYFVNGVEVARVVGEASGLAFNTGSSSAERMRIDSSGNVGIGVTPTANFGPLQVYTSTNGTAAYLGNGAGVHAFNGVGFYSSAATLASSGVWTARSTGAGVVGASNAGTITFYTDTGLTSGSAFTPTTRMTIDGSGNVGIGISSSIAAPLQVYNATAALIQVDGDVASNIRVTRYSTDTNAGSLQIRKSRGTYASPAAVASGDTAAQLTFSAYGGTNYRAVGSISSVVDTFTSDTNISGYLTLNTNSGSTTVTEKMRIDSSGNVGIGTSSPSVKLDVQDTAAIARVTSTTGTNAVRYQVANTGGTSQFGRESSGGGTILSGADGYSTVLTGAGAYPMIFGTNSTERMRIDSSGNVLVGATGNPASAKFFVAGTAAFGTAAAPEGQLTSDGTNAYLDARLTGGGLIFRTNGSSERMRLDSVGNLQVSTGAVMHYAPAPTSIAAATTLTNAQIQGQIISTTGTTYTVTMPLGTTLETLATWATTNISYDFYVINTASGTITIGANSNTTLGSLTIATGVSAQFRIRRTAANAFTIYRLG